MGEDISKLAEKETGEFGLFLDGSEVCSAFRTTLDELILVVVGTILVDMLAKEMSVLCHKNGRRGGLL